ncbi:MAG: hypothetical protein HXX09_09875 [Bacteroidetes bacterium]|nr:hypothetical protein [Bacteroidota bacterium]
MLSPVQRKIIIEKMDIIKVISGYLKLINSELQPRGPINYIGCCPFHHEKTPSFVVMPLKKEYKCFGCSSKGDVIDFIMQIKNINIEKALDEIALEYDVWWSEYNTV